MKYSTQVKQQIGTDNQFQNTHRTPTDNKRLHIKSAKYLYLNLHEHKLAQLHLETQSLKVED